MPVSNRWKGFNARFQVGKETTPGTAVTPTVFVNAMKFHAQNLREQARVGSLKRVGGFRRHGLVTLKTWGEATVEAELTYENYGIFFEAAFGSASSGGGGGPSYTNTFTTGTSETLLPSYTIEAFPTGDLAECIQIEGAVCKQLVIDASRHAKTTISASFMSMAAVDFASGTSETEPTNYSLVLGSEASLSWGGTAHTDAVESVKITIDNDVQELSSIGSLGPRALIHGEERTITVEVTLQCDDTYTRALIDDRIAGTTRALVVVFSDGSQSLTFTAANAEIVEDINPSVDGVGQLTVSVKFEARAAGTPTAAFTLSSVSTTSTAIGNG